MGKPFSPRRSAADSPCMALAMKAATMKAMKKVKKVSIIAKGKRAKVAVFNGKKAKTVGGLTRETLVKSKRGKIVSKKASASAKKAFKESALKKWSDACQKARKQLGIKGFCAVNGKTPQGKALYAKIKAILAN